MNKQLRQYAGLLAAIAAYYLIHEGAHLLYALAIGVFKQVNIGGLGVQIDVYAEQMTDLQMGIFCIVGSKALMRSTYGRSFFKRLSLVLPNRVSINPIESFLSFHGKRRTFPVYVPNDTVYHMFPQCATKKEIQKRRLRDAFVKIMCFSNIPYTALCSGSRAFGQAQRSASCGHPSSGRGRGRGRRG